MPMSRCLNPRCCSGLPMKPFGIPKPAKPGVVYSRELCKPCYNGACLLVQRGRTSWERLEEAGKVLPSKKPGRGLSSAIQWFLEGIDEQD